MSCHICDFQMTQIIKFDLCLPSRGRGRRVGATFLLRTLYTAIGRPDITWTNQRPGSATW